MYRKNVAGQFICFQMLLTATGAVATGLSPAVRRCIDGTFAAGGGTVTEDGTTGSYKYAMSQADTNGNDISFIFSAATAMPVCVNIVTTACDPTTAATFGITNIDAAITSRMASYTQPTGFLAATFPSGTVANTTNITAGIITTVTTVTNQLTAAAIATGIWTDTTAGDFTTALSVGKSLMNGVALGTGLTVNDLTTKTGYSLSGTQTFNVTGNITGNLSGSVGSVTGAVGSVTGAVGSVTGAVASVTGNVGGSVTGSVGSVVGAVGSVTAGVTVTTNNDKTGYTASTVSDKTGYALTTGERNSIADAMLDRDMSTGTDSGSTTVRTVRQALRFLRNKFAIAAGTMTVYKEDDATASWTSAITTTAGNPVSSSDPAGP